MLFYGLNRITLQEDSGPVFYRIHYQSLCQTIMNEFKSNEKIKYLIRGNRLPSSENRTVHAEDAEVTQKTRKGFENLKMINSGD